MKKRKVKRGKARSEERKDIHKWWRKGMREEERESFLSAPATTITGITTASKCQNPSVDRIVHLRKEEKEEGEKKKSVCGRKEGILKMKRRRRSSRSSKEGRRRSERKLRKRKMNKKKKEKKGRLGAVVGRMKTTAWDEEKVS